MSEAQKYPEEKLFFRRQFILGPRFVDPARGSQRAEVRGSIRVTAQPDLPVTQAARDGRSVTLLDHLLDPPVPGATDQEIVTGFRSRRSTDR